MLDLYDYIKNKLQPLNVKIYTDYIPADAVYPYIQLQFSNSVPNGYGELDLMQLDIWDKNQSEENAESIADSVDNIFKRLNETNDNFCIQIYRYYPYYRLSIPVTDAEIRRRELRYTIKIYRKE